MYLFTDCCKHLWNAATFLFIIGYSLWGEKDFGSRQLCRSGRGRVGSDDLVCSAANINIRANISIMLHETIYEINSTMLLTVECL